MVNREAGVPFYDVSDDSKAETLIVVLYFLCLDDWELFFRVDAYCVDSSSRIGKHEVYLPFSMGILCA